MPMTWQESAWRAVVRLTSRAGSSAFSRQQLIEEELGEIVREVGSAGETPAQTLSRVLQELRDQGMIEFQGQGQYRCLR